MTDRCSDLRGWHSWVDCDSDRFNVCGTCILTRFDRSEFIFSDCI